MKGGLINWRRSGRQVLGSLLFSFATRLLLATSKWSKASTMHKRLKYLYFVWLSCWTTSLSKKLANLATYETSLWLKFWWRFLRQDTEKHNIVNRLDCANPVFSQPTRTLLGEIDNSLQQNGKIVKYHKYEEGWRSIVRAALDSQQQTHQHGTKWAGKANIWPKMAKSAYYDFIFWYLGPKINLCFVNRAYYRYNRASTFPFVPTPQEILFPRYRSFTVAHPEFWPFLGSGATEFWSEINETRITLQFPNLTPLAKKSAK